MTWGIPGPCAERRLLAHFHKGGGVPSAARISQSKRPQFASAGPPPASASTQPYLRPSLSSGAQTAFGFSTGLPARFP